MSHTTLKLLHHGSHIVEVALHRPTVLNAMSSTMFSELLSASSSCTPAPLCAASC